MNVEDSGQKKSPAQQAETARRLKPHSRSQINIDKLNRPEGMTPLIPPTKRPKTVKWQFGIRSRNQPAEAMLAIYKALKAMGAEWEVAKARKPGGSHSGEEGGSGGDEDVDSDISDASSFDDEHETARTSSTVSTSASSPTQRHRHRSGKDSARASRYGSYNDWGYNIPHDPWIIKARFRKEGMYSPGVIHPQSTQTSSSRLDLLHETTSPATGSGSTDDAASRRSSTHSSDPPPDAPNSAHSSAPSSLPGSRADSRRFGSGFMSAAGGSTTAREADCAVWVYMTIQLYSIEKEFYLVDFKCAGYEQLIGRIGMSVRNSVVGSLDASLPRDAEDEHEENAPLERAPIRQDPSKGLSKEQLVGAGRTEQEKDVSSPFPFLDVASRLIIQLAETS